MKKVKGMCPCKGCTDRATGPDHEDCHVNCEQFIEWKNDINETSLHEREVKNVSREIFPTRNQKRCIVRNERKRKKGLKEIL